jgi:hypothetical protein
MNVIEKRAVDVAMTTVMDFKGEAHELFIKWQTNKDDLPEGISGPRSNYDTFENAELYTVVDNLTADISDYGKDIAELAKHGVAAFQSSQGAGEIDNSSTNFIHIGESSQKTFITEDGFKLKWDDAEGFWTDGDLSFEADHGSHHPVDENDEFLSGKYT